MTGPWDALIQRNIDAGKLPADVRERKPRELDLPEAKTPKYRNAPTVDTGGRLCDSRLEARVADRLRSLSVALIQQVSIPLSTRPRDRMVLDFLIIEAINPDGSFRGRFADAKGMTTKDWTQKRRRFEDGYGLKIEEIKK